MNPTIKNSKEPISSPKIISRPKILALIGMCGSGKSSAAQHLKDMGFPGVYFGQATMDHLKEKKLEINPKNEKMARETLRRKLGPAAFAHLALPKIDRLIQENKTDLIYIDGLYSFEEYEFLISKRIDLVTVEIYLDKSLRYARLGKRKIRPLSKMEAEERDLLEIKNLNKAPPLALSDFKICNNTSEDDLKKNLERIIKELKKVR